MYLYIFEDGEMAQHPKPPTDLDNEDVDDGVLQVISVCGDEPFMDGNAVVACAMRLLDIDGRAFTNTPTSDDVVQELGWGYAS